MPESGFVPIVALITIEMVMQQRILEQRASECCHADGTAVCANGGEVRPKLGRKSRVGAFPRDVIALPSVLEKLTNFRRFSQREIKVSPQSDGRGL